MTDEVDEIRALVICRIGSLEINKKDLAAFARVICRIGSLEIRAVGDVTALVVICRIGSLEIVAVKSEIPNTRYLPYRQLRNTHFLAAHSSHSYLPYRQLRKPWPTMQI